MTTSLSPELEALAQEAIKQIAAAKGVASHPKPIETDVRCAIQYIFDREARIKRRSSPDTDKARGERRHSYLHLFAEANLTVAQKIVELAMQ